MTDLKLSGLPLRVRPPVEHRATHRELDNIERLRADRAGAAVYSPALLRQARIRADLSQSVVAGALGIKTDLIREWERGKVPAGVAMLKLLILYGIAAADLVED